MKKSMLIMLAMLLGIGSIASEAVQEQLPDKTVELSFSLEYTTPYGVQKTDEEGNPVLDEQGNPVIAFEMKRKKEFPILRIVTKDGSTNAYWLSVGRNGEVVQTPYEGRQAVAVLPMASSEKTYKRPTDGGCHGTICLEYTVERGLGLSPVKCMLSGHFVTNGIIKGRNPLYGNATLGSLIGFGSNDTGIASEVAQLPVYGTFSMTYNEKPYRDKQAKQVLQKADFATNFVEYPKTSAVNRTTPRKLTRYYLCDVNYATPYGVYVLDENKKPILDEKGSPFVEFEINMKGKTRELLKFDFKEDGTADISRVKKFNKDNRNRYAIEWLPFGKLVYLPMTDGNVLGFITYETTVEDRGIGITPANCKGFLIVEKFALTQGQRVPTVLFLATKNMEGGGIVGFSGGSDDGAWGLVDEPLDLKPEHILPVFTGRHTDFIKGPVTLNNTQILKFVKNGTSW